MELEKYIPNNDAKVKNEPDIVVCPTPAVMQMIGAKALDIVIAPSVIYKDMKGKHSVSIEAMRLLPLAISDPICISVSNTPGCVEIITELNEGPDNILVAIRLNSVLSEDRKIKVNRIASLYGQEKINALLLRPMLYWNKAKARPWTGDHRLQLPMLPYPRRASGRRILNPDDLVKYKKAYGMSFSMNKTEFSSKTNIRNLAAVHSLSPEKFLAAVELGGMPMPSVAITRLDRPYEWGGASLNAWWT